MPPPRYQFRIGHLVKLTAFCAVAFAVLRTPAAPIVILVAVGLFVVLLIVCFNRGSGLILVFHPLWFFGGLALAGAVSGALVSSALDFVIRFVIRKERFFREPLTDESCGPIKLRELQRFEKPGH
jgi:hypothetical protein